MSEAKINVKGVKVEIVYASSITYPGGYWKKDKVLIHDIYYQLTDEDIAEAIQYLYDEGFIQDRRTPYELVQY